MPKQATIPTLYDEVKRIRLSDITKNGELKNKTVVRGTITWTNDFTQKKNSISYTLNTYNEEPVLTLDYVCNGDPVNYQVYFTSVPSNLGKGSVWYFVCPHTQKRCRVLYLVDTYFLHREAFKGCMYQIQTFSLSLIHI